MTENIQKIYKKNMELLGLIDKAVLFVRENEYDKALTIIADSVDSIRAMTDAVIEDREYFNLVSTESVMEMLVGIVEAQQSRDYILLADLLELQLVTFICNVQELIMSKEDYYAYDPERYQKVAALLLKHLERVISVSAELDVKGKFALVSVIKKEIEKGLNPQLLLEKGYRIEFSSCGLMTMGVIDSANRSYYMHTNYKITKEAFLTARKWYEEGKEHFIIYGFGMGYAVKELLLMIAGSKKAITVYEADINVLKLACAFSEVEELICHPQVTIVYDPDYQMIIKRLNQIGEKDKICIFYPALRKVEDEVAKEMLMDYLSWARKV